MITRMITTRHVRLFIAREHSRSTGRVEGPGFHPNTLNRGVLRAPVSTPTRATAARVEGPGWDGILARWTEQAKIVGCDLHGGASIYSLETRLRSPTIRVYRELSDAAVFPFVGSRAERLAEGSQHETRYPPRLS